MSVYELGGGWELHYEGGKHVLEPYIGRLDPKVSTRPNENWARCRKSGESEKFVTGQRWVKPRWPEASVVSGEAERLSLQKPQR